MKAVFGVITFAAAAMVVGSAPTLTEGQLPGMAVDQRQLDYYRDTRSQYPQYVSPCAAAAAAAHIPAITPAAAYHLNISPYHGYPQVSQQYGYGLPHYRSMEMMEPEQDIMSYSDMDHMMSERMPMARYGYNARVASHAAYAPIAASPATTAPVFGVFPNANTGGCNVPLLFSCSPSVVPGHIVQSQPHHNYAAAADSYRGVAVEPLAHHDSHENHEEPAAHEPLLQAHEPSHAMVHQ